MCTRYVVTRVFPRLSNVCTRAHWTLAYHRPKGAAILVRGWEGNWFPMEVENASFENLSPKLYGAAGTHRRR